MSRNPGKIIFIVCDTLRYKNLGLYGNYPSPTVNIDNLGNQGVVFENTYAEITKTIPSIASIMSGIYPLTNGVMNHGKNILGIEEECLKNTTFIWKILKRIGYKTYAIDWMSKWFKKDFDYYSGRLQENDNHNNLILERFPKLLFYLSKIDKVLIRLLKRDFILRFYYSFFPNINIPYDPAELVVNKAIKILEEKPTEKLFLYLHLWDPHYPHTRSRGIKSYLFDSMEEVYEKELRYLDSQLGRLFEFLKTTRKIQDTLIIFTSDHGENLNEYGRAYNHEGLTDLIVKVPLFIFHKDLPKKRIKKLSSHVDILPTILDFLRIQEKRGTEGTSLLPYIKNTKIKNNTLAYFEDLTYAKSGFLKMRIRKRGIRFENYKYIETIKGKDASIYKPIPREDSEILSAELFDLLKDPEEKKDISNSKKEVKRKMKKNLDDYRNLLIAGRYKQNHRLSKKITKTVSIIRKAYRSKDSIAIAWKGGKDTTTLMHIIKTIYGKIPFRVFFNDTTLEFTESYEFINKIIKLWNLNLIIIKHDEKELKQYNQTKDPYKKKEFSRFMKITAINKALKKYKFKGFMLGIRRDENPARKNEKYFSKRKDHIRIHPMLDWTEEDIWEYINNFGVPYNELYDQGYRSVGEKPFTKKSERNGEERSGRDIEKEQLMNQLRKLGYW